MSDQAGTVGGLGRPSNPAVQRAGIDDRPSDTDLTASDDGTTPPKVEPMPSRDAPEGEGRTHRRSREHGDVPVLLDKTDDRWAWRRKIRADPRKARLYRVGVAIAGLLLVILGGLTGPLPGPGGIPLVLLGLAVWASEFEWAQRLMQWFKAQLQRFRGWGRGKQTLAWVIFFAVIGCIGYGYLLVIGIPVWLPAAIADKLDLLPGVS